MHRRTTSVKHLAGVLTRTRWLIVASVLWLQINGTLHAADASPSADFTIFREKLKVWHQRFASVKGDGIYNSTRNDKPGLSNIKLVFQVDGPRKKLAFNKNVYVSTSEVDFALNRNSPQDRFFLRSIDQKKVTEDALRYYLDLYLNSPFSIYGLPISEIISHPSFQLTDTERTSEGGKEYLRFSFKFNSPSEEFDGGWMLVSPADEWGLKSYKLHIKGKDFEKAWVSGTVDYKADGKSGMPVPSRATYFRKLGSFGESTVEFRELQFRTSPSAEFKLSFYGLPDINEKTSGGPRRTYIYVSLAIFALILAIVAKRGSKLYDRT